MGRVVVAFQTIQDRVEVAPACGGSALGGIRGHGHFLDRRDVAPDRALLGLDQVQPLVDARRQAVQLPLREPPFFAARFRPSDCRTSDSAALIPNPGGWSGPP
jgi:hypothetical protein